MMVMSGARAYEHHQPFPVSFHVIRSGSVAGHCKIALLVI